MGADLDIPVGVIFDTIRENVKTARAKVKVAAGAPTSGNEEIKDKRVAGNTGTSMGNDSASNPVRWSASVASHFVPRTACKPFTGEVFNHSGDDDCCQGPSAQSFTGGSILAAYGGCSSFVP
ncbi:hypothetical protein AMTRI_Chr02g259510 [Amborella trichopoda]